MTLRDEYEINPQTGRLQRKEWVTGSNLGRLYLKLARRICEGRVALCDSGAWIANRRLRHGL